MILLSGFYILAIGQSLPQKNPVEGLDQGLPTVQPKDDFEQRTMELTSARELRLKEPVERLLNGGGRDQYRVTLKKGEFFQVVAEQCSIHVAVALFGTDRRKI